MRNIPVALASHIAGEVLSLANCIKITKTDGSILRLTTHDRDLIVAGDTYDSGISVDRSAIQMSDNLSVDNAELRIGFDGVSVTKEMFQGDLFSGADFELFLVNWQSVADGVIYLKRGTIGDIVINDETHAVIQLRGLTQALQRSIVEKYSPTCRTNLGGVKCGVPNIPTRVRRDRQLVRVRDWFLAPDANVTDDTLDNGDFEADGAVANGTSGISDWTYGSGSYWKTATVFPVAPATYYLEGGNDGGGADTGAEFTLYQTITTATLGLVNANIDTGDYSIDFNILIAATDADAENPGRLFVEQFDEDGATLRRTSSPYMIPEFEVWQGIGVTDFVLPGCRSIKFGIQARKDEGVSATVAFDAGTIRHWTNVIGTWGGASFRTTAITDSDGDLYDNLDATIPALDYTLNNTTADGGVTVQAKPLVFGYAAVTDTDDNRTFEASAISATAASLYSGKIVWLSGANAGRTSFIRIWNDTTKIVKMYTDLAYAPAIGDKFVYAKGCDKTIVTCGTTFFNAMNFRGEPYLPGPQRVIEFLTAEETA